MRSERCRPGDGASGDAVLATEGWPLRGYSVDLTDGFYQFKCERLASLFGLGVTLTIREVEELIGRPVPSLFDDEADQPVETSPSELVEASFLGMAMGWSWALYFCNESISEAMRTALKASGLPPVLLGDRQRPPHFNRRCPVMAPYVDNANMLAMDPAVGEAVFGKLEQALLRKGFVLRDRVAGESTFEFLGMVLHSDSGLLQHKPRRVWRIWAALTALMQMRRCSGDAMRVVLGHVCHHFGLAPFCLSAVHRLFAFARDHLGRVGVLGGAEMAELRVARALVFSCQVSLWKGVGPRCYCSDASMCGYALHETDIDPALALAVGRWKERWRSREVLDFVDRLPGDFPAEPAGDTFEIAGGVADILAGPQEDCRRPRTALWAVGARARELKEVPAAVPPLPAELVHRGRWALVVAGAWRHPQRIHLQEARTALMGLRRAAEDERMEETVAVSLGDNMAEVLSTERGRASNPALNAFCRKAAALQLCSGIDWRRRHVPTKLNPSDSDSRRADRDELKKGDVFVPDASRRRSERKRAAEVSRALARRAGRAARPAPGPARPRIEVGGFAESGAPGGARRATRR